MSYDQSASSKLYERALKVLPGGVSRNAVLRKPHPCYAVKGEGCYVTDLEGVRRVDFANNMASLIHGHAHPAIVEAVTAQIRRFTASTFATEVEVLFAEHMCNRSRSFEKIRFVNSGTEAIMCCLKVARAYTGRPKIAKVEGAYHGLYDYAEVSQTAAPANWGDIDHPASVPVAHGTPAGALADVIVLPFNDPERAIALLNEHAAQIAAVLIDPLPHRVCLQPASKEFIRAIGRWSKLNGALMVFDEVITFRSEYGGAQEWYDIRPDLTAMGKIIGGGFPVGAIAGRADVMDALNPLAEKVLVPHSGTFSANPVTMTAGLKAMELFDREAVAKVNALGERARRQIAEVIESVDANACVTGAGSLFRIHLKNTPPRNYRESYTGPTEAAALRGILDYLFAHGVMMINTLSGTITTPMTTNEIDLLCEVLAGAFKSVKGVRRQRAAV
jgi:glutamate-1-semialdehyde 2,1-aminomutase